ncbi:MAG: protoporphyrinogen oxidase [Planctomycetaceae bacterium]
MVEPTNRKRVAVIGAGITGLSAAHRLIERGGFDVEVFDANAETGGLLTTVRVGDCLIERGADSFITNKPAALELCLRLGLESQLVRTNAEFRRSLVLHNGKPTSVPAGFQLLMPTQLEPLMQSPLLTDAGKQRVAAERAVPPAAELKDESLSSFVRRRFGDELFERLAQPMVGGIYTADPDKLSLLATLPRFLHMEQQHGSLLTAAEHAEPEAASGARYGLFVSLKDGIQQLVDTLTARVEEKQKIHRGCEVQSVRQDGTRWEVTDRNGKSTIFDSVIVATSTWRAADFLADCNLAAALSEIEYASSAIVCSVHNLADIEHAMDAFGLVIPAIEKRRILAVSFASRKFDNRVPDGHIILRTFVGGAMQPEMLDDTDAELTDVVLGELHDIFGVKGRPLHTLVTRYDRAMPQYHLGHIERVKRIKSLVDKLSGLELAGNAYEGVGIPDSVRSGESAAERIASVDR